MHMHMHMQVSTQHSTNRKDPDITRADFKVRAGFIGDVVNGGIVDSRMVGIRYLDEHQQQEHCHIHSNVSEDGETISVVTAIISFG